MVNRKKMQHSFHRAMVRKSGRAGFSLIEIIIVVALLVTLMTYVIRNFSIQADEAKRDEAKLAMGIINQSLQMYRVHTGQYPTGSLDDLVENTNGNKKWRGPYIERDRLVDPWQVPFAYESDGRNVKLTSGGPNLQIGDEDDVVYPEPTGDAHEAAP